MNFDPQPYDWQAGLQSWGLAVLLLLGLGVFVSLVLGMIVHGSRAPKAVIGELWAGCLDLIGFSVRRTMAICVLTFREAVRRKTMYVFGIFALLFMFSGWYLEGGGSRPEMQVKVFTSFVLTAISWMILPVALLLSCWGIPDEIKSRSLHTVVTKPVRRNEIVMGRFLGYTLVGTLVLAVMSTVGYFWIVRQVTDPLAKQQLVARVPIYGNMTFLDREGNKSEKGVNTGDVWEYRSYIEGATKSRAVWRFENITPERVGDKLLLEANFEAFRTHKGNIGTGLLARYTFVNPSTNMRVPYQAFELAEYRENTQTINREITYFDEQTGEQKTVDLFNDLVDNGSLDIELQCLDAGQYLGAARPDLFIRTPDRPFAVGYFKAVLGIWLMMVLTVIIGVTLSCFVKGPVATLTAFSLILVGMSFRDFMEEMVRGEIRGGGPAEAAYRIVKHMNPTVALDDGILTSVVHGVDWVLLRLVDLMYQVIPDYRYYSMKAYIANGFDVNWDAALLPSILVTIAYIIPCLVLAYYTLKLRELEAK